MLVEEINQINEGVVVKDVLPWNCITNIDNKREKKLEEQDQCIDFHNLNKMSGLKFDTDFSREMIYDDEIR